MSHHTTIYLTLGAVETPVRVERLTLVNVPREHRLRALAMAASGGRVTRALVQNANEYREQAGPSDIYATFNIDGSELSQHLSLSPGSFEWEDAGEDSDFIRDLRKIRGPWFCVVGYGAHRWAMREGMPYPRDPIVSRVAGLFRPHSGILGPLFAGLLSDLGLSDAYRDVTGSFALGPHSTLAKDIVGQWFLSEQRASLPSEMQGIVLIEDHRWDLAPLHKTFPKIQFIVGP